MPKQFLNIPAHIAIIMDGNGRWARRIKMPRVFGHRKGAERVRDVVEASGELGVKALTLYAFSEENWERPADEVSTLMGLLTTYLKKEIKHLHEKNVRLRSIGSIGKLPEECQKQLILGQELTKNNTGLQLTLALSYGGRSEMVEACRRVAERVAAGEMRPEDVTDAEIEKHLGTEGLPDPDLLIRTSGEQRISNFLLWQIAYTEFYFTNVHWPDFTKEHFFAAIEAFQDRKRRFGRVETEPAFESSFVSSSDKPMGELTC